MLPRGRSCWDILIRKMEPNRLHANQEWFALRSRLKHGPTSTCGGAGLTFSTVLRFSPAGAPAPRPLSHDDTFSVRLPRDVLFRHPSYWLADTPRLRWWPRRCQVHFWLSSLWKASWTVQRTDLPKLFVLCFFFFFLFRGPALNLPSRSSTIECLKKIKSWERDVRVANRSCLIHSGLSFSTPLATGDDEHLRRRLEIKQAMKLSFMFSVFQFCRQWSDVEWKSRVCVFTSGIKKKRRKKRNLVR